MNINFLFLLPALALLLFPRQWLRRGPKIGFLTFRRNKSTNPRNEREPGDFSLRLREEFSKVRNYVDLLRGIAGGLMVVQWGITCPQGGKPMLVLAVQGLLLAIGVAAQTLRKNGRLTLFAPIFYLTGLSIAVTGLEAGLSGAALAWVFNAITPTPALFLLVQAVLVGILILLFDSMSYQDFLGVGLLLLPVLLSILARQSLSVVSKKR